MTARRRRRRLVLLVVIAAVIGTVAAYRDQALRRSSAEFIRRYDGKNAGGSAG